MPFPLKIAPSCGGNLNPHLTRGSSSPPDSASQTASQSVQPFSFCTAHSRMSLYFTVHTVNTPSTKLPLPKERSGSPSNTRFLGPNRVLNPNGISVSSPIFAWLTIVTDRPTDRPRYSVCNSRQHLHTAMSPKNINGSRIDTIRSQSFACCLLICVNMPLIKITNR